MKLLAASVFLLLSAHAAPGVAAHSIFAQSVAAQSVSADTGAPTHVVDTLHYATRSGETLFFTLPDTLGTRAVRSYRAQRLPALSWLIDRAFFWRTTSGDGGRYALRFEASYADAPPATLLAIIEVRPRAN